MAKPEVLVLDMSDLNEKRNLLRKLGALQGLYEISVRKRHRVRTNPQNAWYWSCIVSAVRQALEAQWEEPITDEQAHQILKERFLSISTRIVNSSTGEMEPVSVVRSTTSLDTSEFSEYCEKARDFLAEWFGVVVPDPDLFRNGA